MKTNGRTAAPARAPAAAVARSGRLSLDSLSPEMRGMVALSQLIGRADLATRMGRMFGGERDVSVVLGYRKQLTYDDLWAKYDRQDIAGKIVDTPPKATWKDPPWVTDSGDDTETAFMQAWRSLVDRLKIWKYMERVDRLAGIGQYAILLLGLRDDAALDQEAGTLGKPEDVLYFAPYSQRYADIVEWDTDPQSPRFGRPQMYQVTLAAGNSGFSTTATQAAVRVHWSRVIHVAEDLLEDEVLGRPRLQRVFDRLDDLLKLAGGSAEAFWILAAPFWHIDIDKDMAVNAEDLEKLDAQIQEALHGMRRTLQTQGAKSTVLGGNRGVDPTGAYGVLQELISAAADIPMRILFGSERGELASTQDQEEWRGRVAGRQARFAEPDILRPLVDRLVELRALPVPRDGRYEVQWPDLSEPTMAQRATTAKDIAQTAALLSPDNPGLVVAPHEMREEFLGLSPEVPPAPAGAGLPAGNAALNAAGDGLGKASDALEERVIALQRVADRLDPGIRRAFLAAVAAVQDRIDMDALAAALQGDNMPAALVALGLGAFSAELERQLLPVLTEIVGKAAALEAGRLGREMGLELAFDVRSPEVVAWIRLHTAEYVRLIADGTEQAIRETIRNAIERVATSGLAPRAAAGEIYDAIGLTGPQAQALSARVAALEARGVTGPALERQIRTWVTQQRRYRAQVIARHESMAAANGAQIELWRQMQAKGLLTLKDPAQRFLTGRGDWIDGPPAHVLCRCGLVLVFLEDGTAWMKWVVTPDERLCEICKVIPSLEENQPPVAEGVTQAA